MNKIVGKVTESEENEILTLYERRNGLNELAEILNASDVELYEKLVKDLGETSMKFQLWWDRMSQKHKWEGAPSGHWSIDFNTCEISLLTE